MRSAILAFLLLVAPVAAAYGQPSAELLPEMEASVDSAVTDFMSRFQVPGLSIAVAQDGQIRSV